MNTFNVLTEAANGFPSERPDQNYPDSGVENLNRVFVPLFESEGLRRVLAQVDVTFSNWTIEAWWRSLKHQWLYLHQLDSLARVRRLVAFYVQQHNEVMPHSAFNRATPGEVYLKKSEGVAAQLKARRVEAQAFRLAMNRRALGNDFSEVQAHGGL